ncbi:hypothetical protein C0585_01560 [Candidatus Woesearchaeota archaeon]|nr:MAG: hypothetical protein C0585_01560 [Candidatus Woesearchaeota archaeon]
MLDIYTLKNDEILKLSTSNLNKSKLSYVRAVKPDEKEIEFLTKILNVEKEYFTDFLEEEERPRLEKEGALIITYDTPRREKGDIVAAPIKIFVKNQVVVTLEDSNTLIIDGLMKKFDSNKAKHFFKFSPGDFLFKLLDHINDGFLNHVNRIENTTTFLKKKEDKFDNNWIEKVYDSSVTLSFFHQSLVANQEVLNTLRKTFFKSFTKKDMENFNDLYYDNLEIRDNAKIQQEIMLSLFNLQSAIAQQKLNNFMNRITLLAVIIAVPTMISGLYGMNFTYLPFADSKYGFFGILGIMIAIIIGLYYTFKKIDER